MTIETGDIIEVARGSKIWRLTVVYCLSDEAFEAVRENGNAYSVCIWDGLADVLSTNPGQKSIIANKPWTLVKAASK